ncbi:MULTISPECIES: amino acid ABC transporter permease [unclassified Streptomyces]|uniref:amino acid ABC transporter permease n=1 Tax=unclassified Streptomyces TaxID=2593676 RepID=UPI0036C67D17
MAWDEWEQLKAGAAERGGATHMQINSTSVDGGYAQPTTGSGGPDLLITDGPWTAAAGVAQELRTSTHNGLTELKKSDDGMGGGAKGFDCAAALTEIQPTWEARLEAVRDECDQLHGTLGKTGKQFGEIDHDVRSEVGSVHVPAKPGWAR